MHKSFPWFPFLSDRRDIPILLLEETGEFVINLTTKELDLCSGLLRSQGAARDVDKFKELQLTALPAEKVGAPLIAEVR